MPESGKEQKNVKVLLCVAVFMLLCAALALLVCFLLFSGKESPEEEEGNGLEYEANVVLDDQDELQKAVDALYEKAAEGQMALEMQTQANSKDGSQFTCYLANAKKNTYDMYMVLYLDDTQEEIYRSGLIPIGGRLEKFTISQTLESGSYEATLVYNQVEEDRQTVHSQVNVGLNLIVE
ncbi:MAG: hypothetical protein HDR01_15170 [Lachnospiraceae bacterium]|nr:hypothetical protein [Lachnospiraceae bacterium]